MGGILPKGMSSEKNNKEVYVEPIEEEDIQFQEFFKLGIKELQKIRDKYETKSEDIRMVFAFDW